MNELPVTEKAASLSQDASPGSRVRYRVLALAVLLAEITYLDRVCISLTAPAMMRDLGLSKVQMSLVFSAFTLAYTIFEIPTIRAAPLPFTHSSINTGRNASCLDKMVCKIMIRALQ